LNVLKVGSKLTKRCLDIFGACVGLIFLVPVMIFIAMLVLLKIGTPVLFRQTRPSLHGKPFTIYKFLTMTGERDEDGNLLPDGVRLTRFGRFLRKTSLDELPTLWNVLRGDMSLVGPRPLLPEYLPLYTKEQNRRHEVKPGITGWAQVNGRNAISWEEKFKLDVWYVNNRSLWLDMKIILMTVLKVLKREGIAPSDQPIMPRFRGPKGQD